MRRRSVATSVYLSLIGLGLAIIGGVFTWLMWRSYSRAAQIDEWAHTDCAIIESKIEARSDDPDWPESMPEEYRFKVLFSYEWNGETYESDQLSLRGSGWSKSEGKPQQWVDQYPVGSMTECLVNPDTPAQAVLIGESKAPGYSIWFPVLFLVGGLGVAVGAWRRPR